MKFNDNKKVLHFVFRGILQKKPMFLLIELMDFCVGVAVPFLNILLPKYIIDELSDNSDWKKLVFYVVFMVLGNMAGGMLKSSLREISDKYGNWFARYYEEQLTDRVMGMKYEYTESPIILDLIYKAKNGIGAYSGGVQGVIEAFSQILQSVFIVTGVIFLLVKKLPVLVIVLILTLLLDQYIGALYRKAKEILFETIAGLNRRFEYVFFKLTGLKYGKDIRLYDASDMILSYAKEYEKKYTDSNRTQERKLMRLGFADGYLTTGRTLLIYIYVGILALKRIITLGQFTAYTNAGQQFISSMKLLIGQGQDLQLKCFYTKDYLNFMENKYEEASGTGVIESQATHELRLKHVYFKYPGADEFALEDISLILKPGEKLSLVGKNGSGKSTLVKLLCRLYQVESGEILLDGTSIYDYGYESYRKIISTVFQDFCLFSFSLGENLALGRRHVRPETMEKILKQAGLQMNNGRFPKGLETSLYKDFDENGIVPSGGEEQKIALARAVLKDSSFMILDEPTAALDPMAEYDLYQNYNEIIKGKTALFISHRLASCRFCDHIIVMDHKRIVEEGTHEELRERKNGLYAEMFQKQAKYYI